jgi:cysteine synthase
MRFNHINETIGGTPLVRLNRIKPRSGATIWAKLEYFNPLSCVKERPALYMIEEAEKAGLLTPGQTTVVEPTSGNTGIGLAMVCAVKGYRLILTMPESMSHERRKILAHLGAQLVLTEKSKGMKGAIEEAELLAAQRDATFVPQQFRNLANVKAHRESTGPELARDMNGLTIDAFVAGVGTGGTITGVGEFLKTTEHASRIVAVEPAESPVLSGQSPGPHGIQGIGAGFVPGILNEAIIDKILKVSEGEALDMARRLAKEEGMFVGISSGAAMVGALETANRLGPKENVLTLFPDTGERYLSTALFQAVHSIKEKAA